jgi:hypothetical protein
MIKKIRTNNQRPHRDPRLLATVAGARETQRWLRKVGKQSAHGWHADIMQGAAEKREDDGGWRDRR